MTGAMLRNLNGSESESGADMEKIATAFRNSERRGGFGKFSGFYSLKSPFLAYVVWVVESVRRIHRCEYSRILFSKDEDLREI